MSRPFSTPYSSYAPPTNQQLYQQTSPSSHHGRHLSTDLYDPDAQYQQQQQQQQPHQYANPFNADSPPRNYYKDDPDTKYTQGYADEQFNVADDFNNQGPRYGEVYGGQSKEEMAQLAAGTRPTSQLYGSLTPSASRRDIKSFYSTPGNPTPNDYLDTRGHPISTGGHDDGSNVELVTVPTLGADWSKNELYTQTKEYRRGVRRDKWGKVLKQWNRDQRGCCGIGFLTRKMVVLLAFLFCIALGITLYFVIPRAPNFTFPSKDDILAVDEKSVQFSRTPANFSFDGSVQMRADASASYLPVHLSTLAVEIRHKDSSKQIASGEIRNYVLPRNRQVDVDVPVKWEYTGANSSDTTWANVYDACGHLWPGTERPPLDLRITMKMDIRGLVKSTTMSRVVTDLTCPFELPADGV